MIGTAFILIIAGLSFYNFYWKRRNLPPGPIPIPLLGNLIEIGWYGVIHCWHAFAQRYGDIYTLWMSEEFIVCINNYELIQETVVKNGEIYAGRPHTEFLDKLLRGGKFGIIMNDGQLWREHRRFALHVLRNFGLGKNLMQERVLNEVTWLLDDLKQKVKNGDEEINVQSGIDISVGSIINSLIFGYAFHEKSLDEYYDIKKIMNRFVRANGDPRFMALTVDKFGIVPYLPFMKSFFKECDMLVQTMNEFFYKRIDERRQKIDFSQDLEPTDYAEAYLRQQKKLEDAGDNGVLFSDQQLLACIFDMWNAGQETTSNTLAWMILYLMANPETQKRLHEELDQVIGSDRVITLDDKMNLPYVNCVVAETQRLCNLVPANVPRRLTEDTTIRGYKLKKNTIVIPQLSSVLYDEKVFPEPLKFKPERFMDKEGRFQTKAELIPFSIGKRACLGEGLARLELYLFAANLFNQFEITSIPSKPPSLKRVGGVPLQPLPFVVQLKLRY